MKKVLSLSTERRIGSFISVLSLLLSVGISLFYTPFFIRSVGDREYGIFSFVSSIVSWLSTLTICLGSGYQRFVLRERKNNGEQGEALANGAFQRLFILADIVIAVVGFAIWALVFFGVVPLDNYSLIERKLISSMIFVSVIEILLVVPFTHFTAFPYYKEKYIFTNAIPIVTLVFQTGLSFILLKLGFNIFPVLIIHYVVAFGVVLLQFFYSVFLLKQRTKLFHLSEEERKETKRLEKEIFVFSFFVAVNTLIDIFDKNADITILGFIDPSDVTIYQLSVSFRTYLLTIGTAVSAVFTKAIYDACVTDESDEKMNVIFEKSSKIISILVGLVVCGFLGCGEHFVIAWLGKEKQIVYVYAALLLIVWSVPIDYLPATEARRAKNKHQPSSIVYLITTLANFALSIAFVTILGNDLAIWGCVIGTLITTFFSRWVVLPIMDKKMINLNVKSFFKTSLKYLLAGIAVGLLVHFMNNLSVPQNDGYWPLAIREGIISASLFSLVIICFDRKFIQNIIKRKGNE